MTSCPAADNVRELENDEGDSSRESGICDSQNEVDVLEGQASKNSKIQGSGDEEQYDEDEGCGPNESFCTASGQSPDESRDEVAFSLVVGEDETSQRDREKEDVKKLTGFDAVSSQQRRRNETLQWQRQRRDEILDKIRQLEDSAYSDSETEDEMDFAESVRRKVPPVQLQTLEEIYEENAAGEEMEVVARQNKSKHSRSKNKHRHNKNYNDNRMDTTPDSKPSNTHSSHYNRRPRFRQVPCRPMLSEWLLEKPEDFEEMWLGVVCPIGKRVIVMASRGKTKIFSRKDEYLGSYKSLLPGGCRYNYRDSTTNRNRGVTILDCIWSEESQTFYVLDMICWNSHSCVNCDTDYRQFFLTSKFSENLELLERSPSNPFPFKPLPAFSAAELPLVMWSTVAFPEKVDGIVFFHKEAFYISGTNPLTLWILLTQVEPILQVSVSPELLSRQAKVKNLSSRKRQQKMMKQQRDGQSQQMEVGLG